MTPGKEPESLLRELSEERVPPEDPAILAARRERMVAGIGRTIREAAVASDRRARKKKAFAIGLSFAAAAALVLGVSFRSLSGHKPVSAPAPLAQSTHVVASVQSLTGTLVVTHAGRARVVGRGELPTLSGGDELETAADGEATLQTERSRIEVQPATQMSVLNPSVVEERIRLVLGRLDLKVTKQPRSPRSVVVETPDAEVIVRGTEFSVAVGSENDATVTRVRVTEGAVWVLHQGERELLSVGEAWASNGERTAADSHAVAAAAAAAPAPAPSAVEPPPVRTRRGRPTASAAAKRAAAAGAASSLSEENRMYQAALDARNRGDDRKALESFAALIARFPGGHYSELAQVERMRALKRTGDRASAAAEARRYLADHGHEFAREEARGIALGEK